MTQLHFLDTAETQLLIDLYHHLNEAKMNYCVLRNYETLPRALNGGDIDILVDRKDLEAVKSIVDELCVVHSGLCICDYKVTGNILRYCGYNFGWWGLPIDIFSKLEWKCYEYFPAVNVLARSTVYRNIVVAKDGDAYVSAFIKEILANGKDRKNYIEKARLHYLKEKDYYDNILQVYHGRKVALLLSQAITGESSISLNCLSKKCRMALIVNAIKKFNGRIIINKVLCGYRKCTRILKPPGYAVAVLGTDGSGKSTVIDGMSPVLGRALHNAVYHEHMRPNLLPSISKLFGKPIKEGPTTDPHRSKPSGFLGSLLRLSYYSLDYIFGWWFKIYPARVKRPTLHIFDRYFYDYYIDSYRGRINLPKWLIKFYGLFIPQPNLILCLGAEPEFIHQRKPEFAIEEVQRQVADLENFCKKSKRAVWIDTGCSIDESVNLALETITSKMAVRYERN